MDDYCIDWELNGFSVRLDTRRVNDAVEKFSGFTRGNVILHNFLSGYGKNPPESIIVFASTVKTNWASCRVQNITLTGFFRTEYPRRRLPMRRSRICSR